jgi:hypothetical protein
VHKTMGGFARVTNVEALQDFKGVLARFAQECGRALGEVEAEALRTLLHLRQDRVAYWTAQIRVRSELLARAKSQLIRKQVSSVQEHPSVVDERRAVERAKAALEEAELKLKASRRWALVLEREYELFKGACTGLSDAIQRDLPAAIARLERMSRTLTQYQALSSLEVAGVAGPAPSPPPAQEPQAPHAMEDPLEAIRARAARLRALAPSASARASAPPVNRALDRAGAGPAGETTPTRAVSTELAELLGLSGEAPQLASAVVVQAGCLDGRDVALLRCEPMDPEDSGWCVYSADPGAVGGGLLKYRVQDLLERVPAWGPVLALPTGFLAVTSAARPDWVCDAQGEVLWRAEVKPLVSSEPEQGAGAFDVGEATRPTASGAEESPRTAPDSRSTDARAGTPGDAQGSDRGGAP